MAECDDIHRQFDALANGALQVGELPAWTRVQGKVAWYVFQGPYGGMSEGWRQFWHKYRDAKLGHFNGVPGDLYVCPPEMHEADHGAKLTTILFVPL
jgi:hypothetical protein